MEEVALPCCWRGEERKHRLLLSKARAEMLEEREGKEKKKKKGGRRNGNRVLKEKGEGEKGEPAQRIRGRFAFTGYTNEGEKKGNGDRIRSRKALQCPTERKGPSLSIFKLKGGGGRLSFQEKGERRLPLIKSHNRKGGHTSYRRERMSKIKSWVKAPSLLNIFVLSR